MREILFRGKRVDNGEWAYGDLIHTPENKTRIIWFEPMYSDGIDFYNDFNYLVDNETIGQFTGLLDKNGNKIFEGDIVKVLNKPYESKEPIIVVWGKKSYGWSLKFNCGNHYEHKPLIKYYSLPSSKNIEITGNIHDHATL